MANKKTNPAEVLKYFNDIKQARKGAMMNNYKSGGASDADCTTVMVNGKPKKKCKKKFDAELREVSIEDPVEEEGYLLVIRNI